MSQRTIMIVEDNPVNMRLVSYILNKIGYRVLEAPNAEEAAGILVADEKPDLILMDLQLPGLDGLGLTRELKANPDTENIIVAAFTAHAMLGDKEKALEAGCVDYITKPIDVAKFPKQIERLLSLKRD
ncbi:MAG: response regulator [Armatimonadetes bacterium]|nr:response regulator [Armatimonadota bacterium]